MNNLTAVNEYRIRVTLKTHNGIFKPTFRSEEFRFCAESRDVAIVLASANVPSHGFPYQEKSIQVLSALPVSRVTALAPYDPKLLRFDWGTVADAGHRALLNECARLQRQNEATIQSVREATRVVRELTRDLEEAA